MILFHDPKATFVHLRKCGGSSVKRWCWDYLEKGSYEHYSSHNTMVDENNHNRFPVEFGNRFPKHLDYAKTMAFTREDPGFLFTIVRNPWDRLLSTYMFGLQRMCIIAVEKGTDPSSIDRIKTKKGFKHYIYYLFNINRVKNLNKHARMLATLIPKHNYKPLQSTLMGPLESYGLIMRLENIEEEFKTIQKMFNCFEPLGRHKVSNDFDYRDWYDDEMVELLTPKLKNDLDTFGYEF